MKIGIMSDSHENVPMIKKAVEYFNSEKIEFLIHAGDIISPIMTAYLKDLQMEFAGVFGNNDGEKNLWQKRLSEFGSPAKLSERFSELVLSEKKILLIHEPYLLDAYIMSQKYDYIIYGHTHIVDLRREGKTTVINPGETCGYITGSSTVALLDTNSKKTEIIDLGSMKAIKHLI